MWLPAPIYETQPYFLLFVGALSAAQIHNPLMVFFGVLLILLTSGILKMRVDYRKAQRPHRPHVARRVPVRRH